MATNDRLECVLENLYKAALGDVAWVSTAALINDALQTTGHGVVDGDPLPRREPEIYTARFFVGSDRRQDLEHLYFRNYFLRDEAIQRLYGCRDGDLVCKSDLYTERERKESAAYNEFRRINKMENGLFLPLIGVDGSAIVWTFGNSTERGGWGHDQVQAIKRLAPHMRQFVRVRRAMADANALGTSLADMLENRHAGIIQLDRRGRILEANDEARNLLLKREGLRDEKGVLVAEDQAENAELQRLLSAALPPFGLQGAGGSIKIARRKARLPLVLDIHPVRGMGGDHPAWQVRALVLIVDLEAGLRVNADLAGAVLGLTPAETRVAVGLTTGQSVSGVAGKLGCAESTVKTHLKSIYRKLEINKQTELVQRVSSLQALRGSFR